MIASHERTSRSKRSSIWSGPTNQHHHHDPPRPRDHSDRQAYGKARAYNDEPPSPSPSPSPIPIPFIPPQKSPAAQLARKVTKTAGREQSTLPRPRDCSERRDDGDVRMGSERNRRDGFGRGRRRVVSSMAAPAWVCWCRADGRELNGGSDGGCVARTGGGGRWKSRREEGNGQVHGRQNLREKGIALCATKVNLLECNADGYLLFPVPTFLCQKTTKMDTKKGFLLSLQLQGTTPTPPSSAPKTPSLTCQTSPS